MEIARRIFKLIPKGIQERIKLLYYNYKIKDFSFSKENGKYRTTAGNSWSILTGSPLYFIVKDVKRYERFYSINPADVVIDAGANEGILTLIYSQKVKKSGKVFAFEPDKKNINAFNNNLSFNNNINNIYLQEKGLWDKVGLIDFYEAGTVGSSIFYESVDAEKKEIEVISIDEFVSRKNIQKLDFIKMDIEGAEIEALRGAVLTINILKPNFAIASYHVVNEDYTYKMLENFFRELNYPFRTEFYSDGEIITYAGPQLSQEYK